MDHHQAEAVDEHHARHHDRVGVTSPQAHGQVGDQPDRRGHARVQPDVRADLAVTGGLDDRLGRGDHEHREHQQAGLGRPPGAQLDRLDGAHRQPLRPTVAGALGVSGGGRRRGGADAVSLSTVVRLTVLARADSDDGRVGGRLVRHRLAARAVLCARSVRVPVLPARRRLARRRRRRSASVSSWRCRLVGVVPVVVGVGGVGVGVVAVRLEHSGSSWSVLSRVTMASAPARLLAVMPLSIWSRAAGLRSLTLTPVRSTTR